MTRGGRMNKSTGRYGIVMGLALVILGTGFSSSAWADSVAATVNVGIQPWGVAVNPVTNKIYVANLYSNNVTVIDESNNTTETVAVGVRRIVKEANNPATNNIYVDNDTSNGKN